MAKNFFRFVQHDLWLLEAADLPRLQAYALKILKIILLAGQGFGRDQCALRASALSLYTLLAVVPVIAMLFGIAKGFGLEELLEQQLLRQVPQQDTTLLKIIGFARNLLANTKGGVVAGVGVMMLLWTVINMISNIEASFNTIWRIKQGRKLSRKLSDYLSFMMLAPLLLILASSMTVVLQTSIAMLDSAGAWSGLLLGLLSYSPMLLMAGLFSVTFIFMPNGKVKYTAGIVAGVLTGITYHFVQWLYLSLQIGVSGYNAIYGSLAALPLFVIWVQTGWMIALFGCELAFYIQNFECFRHNENYSALSSMWKKILALQIEQCLVKHFLASGEPMTAAQIARQLNLSRIWVELLVQWMCESHLTIGLNNEEGETVFLPGADSNVLSVAYVLKALEHCGSCPPAYIAPADGYEQMLNGFGHWLEASEQNRLLKDLSF